MDKQQVQLKDVELMWPNLTEKSEMSDKYQVDLVNLGKKQVQLLEAAGLTVRDGKKESKNVADPSKADQMAAKGISVEIAADIAGEP